MRVYIETLGCQMNKLDSELVASALRAEGHEVLASREGADAVLYNTCSVRQHAEAKVLGRLGAEAQRKAAGARLIVGVIGCMAQRRGPELREDCPQVDIVCAPGQIHDLPAMLARAATGETIVATDPARNEPVDSDSDEAMDAMDLSRDPSAAASATQAFVRVQRGCNFFCSYCIVPFTRGPERSREPGQIVAEARRLIDSGRSEITLLGQTVNSYRYQAGETVVRFSDLLQRVAGIEGLRRLRFVTSHPRDFGNDVLEAMRDLPAVCEYIHCPAQSGSDAVLAAMNRKYTRGEYDDWVDRARAIVPGVVLAGDFIVGFPGETEADHQASADLIRRSRYKNSFIFKYSPRPGTVSERKLADAVPDAVKKRRNAELLAVQQEVGLAHHRAYVGSKLEVLVEGPSVKQRKGRRAATGSMLQLAGRSRGDHIVVFDGPASLAGQYVDIHITDATALTLMGTTTFVKGRT
jgi:tRNA-2-methylthio-N6-dimethylallyladenosine synthase